MKSALRRPIVTWRIVAPFLGASIRRLGYTTVVLIVRAVAEAALLVLVARVALGLSEGEERIHLGLGPFGEYAWSNGQAVLVSLALGGVLIVTSVMLASVTARMAADATATARRRMLRAFLQASWDLQARERLGRLQDLLTSYVARVANGVLVVSNSLMAVLSLLVLGITALVVNLAAAGAMLVAIAGVGLLFRPLNRISRDRSRVNALRNRDVAESVSELVSFSQEVRVFGVERSAGKRIDRSVIASREALRGMVFVRKLVPQFYQSFAVILIAAGLGLVVLLGINDIAALGVVVLLFIRAVAYGQQLQTSIQTANEVIPQLQELRRQEARYRAAALPRTGSPITSIGALEFVDVHFAYGDDRDALAGLTCELEQGAMVGVVGPSGSGKSTLVQLILRLRSPTSGRLDVNGAPVSEFDLGSWYQRVAMVPQKPQLFEGTVAENIAFFRDVGRDEIERVARLARIHDEIMEMEQGYDALLSGVGGAVSGGQAQRLCIARALVGSPDLIVFDEPTSALDVRSEAAVQQTLEEMHGRVTMVIIAHRLSTLRVCDRIMVLENGKLQAFDVPTKLLEQDGFYREAFDLSQIS